MRKLPKLVLESAQRIAATNGVSVDAVIDRYMAATKNAAVSVDDFFWGHSDISLPRKRACLRSQNRGRAALSKVVRKKAIKQ